MKFPPRMHDLVVDNLREIPDFPTEGVLFRDITPLLANGEAFKELITLMAEHYRGKIDAVAGLESRGFILAQGHSGASAGRRTRYRDDDGA